MSDIKDKDARSRNMAAIKAKDTRPEIYLRTRLFKNGLRYRLHSSLIPGHPDIFIKKYNTAIFVNGCFWHRHTGCKYAYTPKTNVEFWQKKFQANILRDSDVYTKLNKMGIRYIIVWECSIKEATSSEEKENKLINRILTFIKSQDLCMEI